MSTKLSFSDIVDLFVAKTGQTKKEADIFLRELLDVMSSKVCEDGVLKLKDFGTFKVVDIESRESVDVNTGSKIVIAPHRKISFIPDKNLKDLVNKPFSLFQPEPLNDGVNFEEVSLDEIIDKNGVESENNISSIEKAAAFEPDTNNLDSFYAEEPKIEETIEEEKLPDVGCEKDVSIPQQTIPVSGEPPLQKNVYESSEEPIEEVEKNSLRRLWLIAGACFATLLLAALAFSFFNADEDRAVMPIKTEEKKTDLEPAQKIHLVVKKDTSVSSAKQMKSSADTTKIDIPPKTDQGKEANVSESVKAKTEIVSQGMTFRTLALKHYGSKEYWVYIYQANKSTIPNPDKLKMGATIVIPNKSQLGIDVNNSASIARARQLSEKVLRQLE